MSIGRAEFECGVAAAARTQLVGKHTHLVDVAVTGQSGMRDGSVGTRLSCLPGAGSGRPGRRESATAL